MKRFALVPLLFVLGGCPWEGSIQAENGGIYINVLRDEHNVIKNTTEGFLSLEAGAFGRPVYFNSNGIVPEACIEESNCYTYTPNSNLSRDDMPKIFGIRGALGGTTLIERAGQLTERQERYLILAKNTFAEVGWDLTGISFDWGAQEYTTLISGQTYTGSDGNIRHGLELTWRYIDEMQYCASEGHCPIQCPVNDFINGDC